MLRRIFFYGDAEYFARARKWSCHKRYSGKAKAWEGPAESQDFIDPLRNREENEEASSFSYFHRKGEETKSSLGRDKK